MAPPDFGKLAWDFDWNWHCIGVKWIARCPAARVAAAASTWPFVAYRFWAEHCLAARVKPLKWHARNCHKQVRQSTLDKTNTSKLIKLQIFLKQLQQLWLSLAALLAYSHTYIPFTYSCHSKIIQAINNANRSWCFSASALCLFALLRLPS